MLPVPTDADTAVDERVTMNVGASAEERQCCGDERPLKDEDQGPDEESGEQRAAEMVHELILVPGPVRLCHQAGRRDAQKAEGPIDGVEKDASHGDAAQHCRADQHPISTEAPPSLDRTGNRQDVHPKFNLQQSAIGYMQRQSLNTRNRPVWSV